MNKTINAGELAVIAVERTESFGRQYAKVFITMNGVPAFCATVCDGQVEQINTHGTGNRGRLSSNSKSFSVVAGFVVSAI